MFGTRQFHLKSIKSLLDQQLIAAPAFDPSCPHPTNVAVPTSHHPAVPDHHPTPTTPLPPSSTGAPQTRYLKHITTIKTTPHRPLISVPRHEPKNTTIFSPPPFADPTPSPPTEAPLMFDSVRCFTGSVAQTLANRLERRARGAEGGRSPGSGTSGHRDRGPVG